MAEPPIWGGTPGDGPDAPEPEREATPPARAGGRHAAHRAPRRSLSERIERRYVLLAVVVLGLLVAGVLAFGALSGDDEPSSSAAPGSTTPTAPATGTTPVATATPTASQSVVLSDPTTRATTTTPTPTASPKADDEPGGERSEKPRARPAAKAPVLVLNNSRVTGLAARWAGTIRAGGWTVTRTDNWTRSNLARTTVFYAKGDKAAAQAFAKKFDVVADVKPALPGMGPDLTLVLTSAAA